MAYGIHTHLWETGRVLEFAVTTTAPSRTGGAAR
jgi:hypothetical protein